MRAGSRWEPVGRGPGRPYPARPQEPHRTERRRGELARERPGTQERATTSAGTRRPNARAPDPSTPSSGEEVRVAVLPQLLSLRRQRPVLQRVGPELIVRQNAVRQVLGHDPLLHQGARVDLVQRGLIPVEVDEVLIGDAVVEEVVEEEMREHRLLRGRANREAVVLDRHLAVGCLPVGEGARWRSLWEVVDVARDHVPRPRLVEPTRPLRDRLVLNVVHLDVADAVELLEVGYCLVDVRWFLRVDVRYRLAMERHVD